MVPNALRIVLLKTCRRNTELLQTCLGIIQLAFIVISTELGIGGEKKDNCTARFLPSNTPELIGKLWKKLLCDQLLNYVELEMIKGEIQWGLLSQEVFMGNGGLILGLGENIRLVWAEEKARVHLKRNKKMNKSVEKRMHRTWRKWKYSVMPYHQ